MTCNCTNVPTVVCGSVSKVRRRHPFRRLYPGFFLPVQNTGGIPAAALHVPGCMLERENAARGESATVI